ncbi:MAG: hypothetical protein RL711_1899 [Bacteroidota bacterium]
MNDKLQTVLTSAAFRKLVVRKWTISILLTLIMLSAYFGFIITIALDKTYFSQLIADNITLAIPVGIGLIIFAWLMTGVYTYWANHYYDKEVEAIKKQIQS